MNDRSKRKARGKKKANAIMPVSPTRVETTASYAGFLEDLKERIAHERLKAVLSANAAMALLYWDIANPFSHGSRKRVGDPELLIVFPMI